MNPLVNVLHLATFDAHGGAAVAALRLIDGLRRHGHDARLLVREKSTTNSYVDALAGAGGVPAQPRSDPAVTDLAWLFTQRARAPKSDAPFSSDLPAYDIASHPAVKTADVLHLHWVAGFLSAYEIGRLQDLGKPIVWTLHDEFPFTGGCHYTQRCRGYARTCSACPQLAAGAQELARLTLAQKRQFIDPLRVALAAPSRWLAASARRSALFGRARIDVVPYGIDVAARCAISPAAARDALDIPRDAIVVFASSFNHREVRKGGAHLVAALDQLRGSLPGRAHAARRLLVLTAGDGIADTDVGGLPARVLGPLGADDPRLMMAYRAADVFVLPSLEDNLPNTLLESMAAGTPVVAYRTGGIPDFLVDGVNGRLVPRGRIDALADALRQLVADEPLRRKLGAGAAATAERAFDWPIQVGAYERIYEREIGRTARAKGRTTRRRPTRRVRPRDTAVDAPRIATLFADRSALRLFTSLLREEIADLRRVVEARGGEINALKDVVAGHTVAELQDVIASRGGEIRELRLALAEMERKSIEEPSESQRLRDAIGRLMRGRKPGARAARVTLGIFGVGEHGRRVVAAAAILDCAIAWLADNNPETYGQTDLGCEVMAPARAAGQPCDAVVIASGQRDAIRAQLIALGIDEARILAPDLSRTDAELHDELRRLIAERRARP